MSMSRHPAKQAPAQTILHYGFKVSLGSQSPEGLVWNCVHSDGLNVHSSMPGQVAQPDWNYERCVFTVEPVDHQSAATDYKTVATVSYGQLVQLRHVSSDKYFCVNRKVQAETEKNGFKVMLAKKSESMADGRSSVFALKPLYRVRQEGESVRLNDQVMFVPTLEEFSKTRYLCASTTSIVSEDTALCYEVTASLTPTSWTLLLYDDMCNSGQDNVPSVRTGSPVILFQKAIEGSVSVNLEGTKTLIGKAVSLPDGLLRAADEGQDFMDERHHSLYASGIFTSRYGYGSERSFARRRREERRFEKEVSDPLQPFTALHSPP